MTPVGLDRKWKGAGAKAALIAGLVLTIVCAKFYVIYSFASPMPLHDQWASEGEAIYRPILDGTWDWRSLFAPSNEHRITPTRILATVLFFATGKQWDPTLQLVVNAFLHAAALACLWLLLSRRSPASSQFALLVAVLLIGILPFAHENTLWAFQNQFYFLVLFSFLAGWGLLTSNYKQPRWWLGFASGWLALVSMGSGGLTGLAILAVSALDALKRRKITLNGLATLATGGILLAATFLFRTEVSRHDALAAHTWDVFATAFWQLLSWPLDRFPPAGLLFWLPLLLMLWSILKRRESLSAQKRLVLFVGTMIAVQLAALALKRGAAITDHGISSRYLDLVCIGLIANLAAMPYTHRHSSNAMRVVWALWFGFLLTGLLRTSLDAATWSLPTHERLARMHTASLSTFLATNNPDALKPAEQWDRSVNVLTRWSGMERALPPELQPGPLGFAFAAGSGFDRIGFDPTFSAPAWRSQRPVRLAESTPSVVTRGGLLLRYLTSNTPGDIRLSLLNESGSPSAEIYLETTSSLLGTWNTEMVRVEPGTYVLRVEDTRAEGSLQLATPQEISSVGVCARSALRACMLLAPICLSLLVGGCLARRQRTGS